MAVLPIIVVPDERLLKKCDKVTEFGENTQNIVRDLVDTLDGAQEPEGAGIAAPQIGVCKRIVVVRNFVPNPNDKNDPIVQDIVMINPKIVSASKETITDWEGCLSVPDTYGKVKRARKVKVKAQDENGDIIRITASGYFATVIQHEIDHLDGTLFTSKVEGNTISEKELDRLYSAH